MSVPTSLWDKCLSYLRDEIPPQQYNAWIRPLHAVESKQDGLLLLALNRFVLDWINERFLILIREVLDELTEIPPKIKLQIGSKSFAETDQKIWRGVGLGKTHLMHAVGNAILQKNPEIKVLYLHSERFAADMIKALQYNAISNFKCFYRSINTLLIDDMQFFAGKNRSQEEFFHTFNSLLYNQQQIILTCDCYHKEINRLEERLQLQFGWWLTVVIEPPELETRVSIALSSYNCHRKYSKGCGLSIIKLRWLIFRQTAKSLYCSTASNSNGSN